MHLLPSHTHLQRTARTAAIMVDGTECWPNSQAVVVLLQHTIFPQIDAMATIYFVVGIGKAFIEGRYYLRAAFILSALTLAWLLP